MRTFSPGSIRGKEETKVIPPRKKPKDISEYKEFQKLLEGLDRVKKVLPSDHRSINRSMLQLHHLLKRSSREGGPYELAKISQAYFTLVTLAKLLYRD